MMRLEQEIQERKLSPYQRLLLMLSVLTSLGSSIYLPPRVHAETPSQEMSTNRLAYALAELASPIRLPKYDATTYWNIRRDGWVTPEEERKLYETYYPPSPELFVGSATDYGAAEKMYAKLIKYTGPELRQQMERGYVLTASGAYGYHDNLLPALQAWKPDSLYGRHVNPNDSLLDNQAAPLYAFLAEQNLGGLYNHPLPVPYEALNKRQKLLFDLTEKDGFHTVSHFVPIPEHQRIGPDEALDSGTYVSAIATKSPNDIGRRLLLFKDEGEIQFYGVVLVVDVASRADWTGTGGVLDPISPYHPLMLRSQQNKDGVYEQWGFDLPTHIYEAMGGTGGPAFGIIAVDAELLE